MVDLVAKNALIEAMPEDVGLSSSRLQNVTRLVQTYIDDGRLPGAISMVARRGKVVHFETYGNMDAKTSTPMAADTIFRLYSMTKPIASVALMTLYEEGRFQLDDAVSRFIPEFREQKVFVSGTAERYEVRSPVREMTVRDILMHTAGLPGPDASVVWKLYERNNITGLELVASNSTNLAEVVAKLGQLPLCCDPGSQWNYGMSTDVVARLCEVITGTAFDEFLEERIFKPLQIRDTGFGVQALDGQRFAINYRRGGPDEPKYLEVERPERSPFMKSPTYFSGVGGLVSTASDYMRFCKMLANQGELEGARILGPRTLSLMTRNHLPEGRDLAAMNGGPASEAAREGAGFGLGFAVLLDPVAGQTLGTSGEYHWGGLASTAFFVSPAEDLIMLFLTQLMPSSSYPIRRELRATTYQAIID